MDDLLLDNNLLNSYKAFTGSHFMFNVINAIQSDLLLTKNKEAFQTLQTFNRLYKYAVKCSNEQYTTLEDEIQFLNQYLSMEQIRFSSSHFPKSISVGSFPPETLIPTYVFQPLVENAILLSLENKAKNNLHIHIAEYHTFIRLLLKMNSTNKDPYHPKIIQKTKYAEERLNLLSKFNLIEYEIDWGREGFMSLDINYLDH